MNTNKILVTFAILCAVLLGGLIWLSIQLKMRSEELQKAKDCVVELTTAKEKLVKSNVYLLNSKREIELEGKILREKNIAIEDNWRNEMMSFNDRERATARNAIKNKDDAYKTLYEDILSKNSTMRLELLKLQAYVKACIQSIEETREEKTRIEEAKMRENKNSKK